jgi:hypothetical protein
MSASGEAVPKRDQFERDTEDKPRTSAPAQVPGDSALLGLQRGAGNRAVTSLLEGAADAVAREHAEPLAREHGWFGEPGGLDATHAQRNVGALLGADLSDVEIRSGRLPGAPSAAMGSVQDRVVHLTPGGFSLGTPIGQALLAHELSHVVQQSDAALPAGPGVAHADHGRPMTVAPAGMAQHSIACSSNNTPAPKVATTFDDVKKVYDTSPDATARTTALTDGIATARANASRLYRNANSPPVSTIRRKYETETRADVPDNPLIGVSQDSVERAYQAWAENPGSSEPPWVLLAIWTKEGLGEQTPEQRYPSGIPASSAADAKAIYRSVAYYMNFGADVYLAHTAGAGDNTADFTAGTGAAHDTAFRGQIARQVTAGRLPRDVGNEINAELTATPAGAGRFTVTATPRFAVLSLMLVDAFYREQKAALTGDPRVGGGTPDPGLVYMKWNMKASSFEAFLNRPTNPDPDGSFPSKEEWAFHRPIAETEYGQSRRNAMRFKYLLEVFKHAYQDKS